MAFQDKLSYLMKERKVSQRELAEYVGVVKQSISLYASGKRTPDINALKKMCEYFNVSADYLIGIEDDDTTKLRTERDILQNDINAMKEKLDLINRIINGN